MSENGIEIPVETEFSSDVICVLTVEQQDQFALLSNGDGKYLTAQGEAVVLANTVEPGSCLAIHNSSQTDLSPNVGWFSLESANDPGRFLRHYSL